MPIELTFDFQNGFANLKPVSSLKKCVMLKEFAKVNLVHIHGIYFAIIYIIPKVKNKNMYMHVIIDIHVHQDNLCISCICTFKL